jgi:hypothetical protein
MPMSIPKLRPSHPLQIAIVVGAAFGTSFPALGATQLLGEAVNAYSSCGVVTLTKNIANVNGFLSGMTTIGGVSWPVWRFWQDGSVWDRDFLDDQLSPYPYGYDSIGFDWSSNTVAISYFSGHGLPATYPDWDGVCDSTSSLYQPHCCSTGSDCVTPPAGQSLPGSCTKGPNVLPGRRGYCMYNVPRQAQVCGSGDVYSHLANLTNYGAFGESANSGGWRGVATNGGVNFAIFDMSIAARPGLETAEIGPQFAGLHGYATVMPTTIGSDIIDADYRGANFAALWRMNPNSSIARSWATSLSTAPTSAMGGGSPCTYGGTDGGHGISGCGSYWVGSKAETTTKLFFQNRSETWIQAQDDNNDSTNGNWITWTYVCNYDCNTYPVNL